MSDCKSAKKRPLQSECSLTEECTRIAAELKGAVFEPKHGMIFMQPRSIAAENSHEKSLLCATLLHTVAP